MADTLNTTNPSCAASLPALGDYYDRLRFHDWHYEMSDDSGMYRRGKDSEHALEAVARQSDAHKALFDAWAAYVAHTGPMPMRPESVARPIAA